ncbi:MAG: hypothetical protein DRI39_08775 [Chloroflexi bacterium]|nr:MAG: hypothetical protein DRI39_08775 [Chloroflexota bacterium]
MALTLDQMVAKGKSKLSAKASVMKSNYDAAKSDMKTSYSELPFGPNTTAAYNAGIDAAVYRTPDVEKWARNWRRKVSR